MRATKFEIPLKRFGSVVKIAPSSPVEHFKNKVVFWKKSCFLFTLWTWSELSFWILAEVSSRFVQIAFLSRVECIGKNFFLSKQCFFSSFDFREKKYQTFDAGPTKLSKLHSICSRSRFEGTIDSGENPFFLSFSCSNELTSNLYNNYQAGLSELRFDVEKFTFRKDNFFITIFLFFFCQVSGIQAKTSRILGEKSQHVCRISLPMSPFIVQGSISWEKFHDFCIFQRFCIFNNNFRTSFENCSAGLSKLQSRV